MKTRLFAVATVCVIGYALGAFIAWNPNPGEWPGAMRGFVCLLSVFFSVVAALEAA